MAARWSPDEWDLLFAAHPPFAAHRPTSADVERLRWLLGRDATGIRVQWQHAEAWLSGERNHGSPALRRYLVGRYRISG